MENIFKFSDGIKRNILRINIQLKKNFNHLYISTLCK